MTTIRLHHALALLLAGAALPPAGAATTDISQQPLIVANPDSVKANLLFIIDDSGSMGFDYLPDHTNTALCRSTGATPQNSGNFGNRCCINGSDSAACWLGAAPFGTARGQPPFLAAGFNGQAYDPAVTYKPPVRANGEAWPSQTRAVTSAWSAVKNDAYNVQNTGSIDLLKDFPDTEWCVDDGSLSDCLRNDNYVLPGTVNGKAYTRFNATRARGSGWVASGAPDAATVKGDAGDASNATPRSFGPHYYRIHSAEYCSGVDLRDCRASAQAGYTIPAPVRWCNSDANARATTPAAASCQATRNNNFSHARYPTKFFSAGDNGSPGRGSSLTLKLAVSGCSGNRTTAIGSLKIGGVEMLSGATDRTNNPNVLATKLVAKFKTTGGWKAVASAANVTITAPVDKGNIAGTYATLSIAAGANCSFTPTANAGPFANDYQSYAAPTPGRYAGRFERVDIVPGATYPRAATRGDCAAAGCSYDEEMTNFANWWAYYRTRMQAMKSSAALAFGDVGSNRRVGYMSINNNTGSDLANLAEFADTERSTWFSKLFAAKPNNSTPLRGALSAAGRLFAGSYNGQKLNGVTVKDPVQYACQKNITILSTDGFWNESGTPKRPGGAEIGDVDSAAAVPRPQLDGLKNKNTLADVAYYFANTDLRDGSTGQGSCTSGSGSNADVCGTGDPRHEKQTMTTFTLGLGVSGYMQFARNYASGGSADFNAVANGDAANAGSGVCSWQTAGGTCNWPEPANNTLTAVDDLWHAAVNGGGTYFSAGDPTALYEGLKNALGQTDAKIGAAAAATVSNPNVTAGDNTAFVSMFMSSYWSGDLQSKAINLDNGELDTVNWSARTQLEGNTSRKVYMFSAGSANGLKNFDHALMTAGEQAYFSKAWVSATGRALTQFCTGPSYCLDAATQDLAAGAALVDFLRGDRRHEGPLEDGSKYYRARTHLLGDIVNSAAAYVNRQLVKYNDAGYAEFNAQGRQGMVYVGANDGMLHAFNASTGAEAWAYVPSAVLPNLYRLADKQYASQHQAFVDGSPFVQDMKIGDEWRTLLVGGLGAGGRGYYALDVTNPAEPKALWEFGVGVGDTDANCPSTTPRCNMGYSFGKPEIGKLASGQWVVVLPSGYNNVKPGDGKGRIFVLDAATGQPVTALPAGVSTGVGDTTTPSGLGHIRAWLDHAETDNTIQRLYGGDTLGNVWRFDVNNSVGAAGYEATRLAVLKNGAASPKLQPVTSRPELGKVGSVPMVYVGTGRYLGLSDLSDATVQSVYGIRDDLTDTGHGEVRAGGNFVQQTLAPASCPTGAIWCKAGTTVRMTQVEKSVNLAEKGGWYVDLPLERERVNTDPLLALGVLTVVSNVIQQGDVCNPVGSSWLNYFDYRTGAVKSVSLGGVLGSSPEVVALPNENLHVFIRCSDGSDCGGVPPYDPKAKPTRRISWRDLLQQ
ncbi:MAG: PilC/PilY family type IV pilus protein [Roseateles sp.]|uniref:pilus assembly protein n=1 Tax=Roseateles sp. TaxID=1971397 RepID=UPI0039ED6DC2